MAYDPYDYLDEMDDMSGCCGGLRDCGDACYWDAQARKERDAPDHLSAILSARGARYGSFEDNSEISQALKEVIHHGFGWFGMASDSREALDMIAAKISRIVTGDPDYADNWDDIAGYAKLVADRLRRDQVGVPGTVAGAPEGAR